MATPGLDAPRYWPNRAIAIGPPVTGLPPHGSRRAEFPHRALSFLFPWVSGVEAQIRPGMRKQTAGRDRPRQPVPGRLAKARPRQPTARQPSAPKLAICSAAAISMPPASSRLPDVVLLGRVRRLPGRNLRHARRHREPRAPGRGGHRSQSSTRGSAKNAPGLFFGVKGPAELDATDER